MPLSQEVRLSFNVEAKFANRFALCPIPEGLFRIAFGEMAVGEDKSFHFHTALLLSPHSAKELRDGLTKLIERMENASKK